MQTTATVIVAAAIKQDGYVYALPAPADHAAVAEDMVHRCGVRSPIDGERGFLTSTGRFVGASSANKIARNAGQLSKPQNGADTELRCDDLWGFKEIGKRRA